MLKLNPNCEIFMNGVYEMKKTNDFSNLPSIFRQKEEDAAQHNVALMFAKLNSIESSQTELVQAMNKNIDVTRSYWLDLKKDVSDLQATLNTLVATLNGRGVEVNAPQPESTRKTPKRGLAVAVTEIMEDGIARHVYDIYTRLKELDGEGWDEASVGTVLANQVKTRKIEKIRRGVYRKIKGD